MQDSGHTPEWTGPTVERVLSNGKRIFALAFRRWLVEQTRVPGASVAGLALRHGKFELDFVTGKARLFPGQTLERPQVVQDMATNATLRTSLCLTLDDETEIARMNGAAVAIVRERFRADIG